jgi:hypothetical protein
LTYPSNPHGGQPHDRQLPEGTYLQPATPPRSRDSGLAIGALICSIAGFFTGGLITIAGIIIGHVAFRKARRGEAGGKGIALAAFIIGYLIIVAWASTLPVLFDLAAKHRAIR